jgi:hypothetical protein
MSLSIGRSQFKNVLILNTWDKECRVELHMTGPDAKAHFDLLESRQPAIEAEFGMPLTWRRMDDAKASIICLSNSNLDPNNREHWPAMLDWFTVALEQFYRTFANRIKALDISQEIPELLLS